MSPAIEVIDHLGDTWLLGLPGRCETYNGLTEMWVYVLEGPPFTQHKYQQIPIPILTEWFAHERRPNWAGGVTETFGTERSVS